MTDSKTHTNYHEAFDLPSFDDHIFLVYGYGSILWKQNFEFDAEYETYIKGYKRVFYQGSRDHRGVPGKPGRVVTILPDEDTEARVYGKVYQLPQDPEKLNKIFQNLDVREQGGYERINVTVYDSKAQSEHVLNLTELGVNTEDKGVVCLCYNATVDNEVYLGPASMEAMAQQILDCSGPSGPNRDYLFFLADSLREMGVKDPHVFELAEVAKRLLAASECAS